MIKQVIDAEMKAISVLSKKAGEYEKAADILSECKGKLVFMGVGKSGHIAKKLAATFASLGTPSFFVHSTEAMHGDLGMIEKSDFAILISNSGKTKEVIQNVAPQKNNGVKTIAFTSKPESPLVQNCDYAIIYPDLAEADENGLAPTVSTTLALVLGDAIACELSARREFTREDFHRFHPNGALGEMLSKEKK